MSRKFTSTAALAALALALAACGTGGGSPTGTTGTAGTTGTTAETGTDTGTTAAANGETHVWKFAFNQLDTHPIYIATMEMGQKLTEATEGRYVIEGYPNELLGSQSEALENVTQGAVELAMTAGPLIQTYSPDFGIFNLPYVFDSVEAQIEILGNSEIMDPLYTSMEDSKDITIVAGFTAGFRNIYSNKEIATPADLQGMKIRVQQNDSQLAMMQALGGIGTPMGQGDVYTALQSGVLDGAENNEIVYHGLKHDEVAKVYSYTKHLVGTDFLCINTDVLNSMSDADREVFLGLLEDMQAEGNAAFLEALKTNRTQSEAIGAEFFEDVDIDAFKAQVQPVIDQYMTTDSMKAIYEQIQQANENNK